MSNAAPAHAIGSEACGPRPIRSPLLDRMGGPSLSHGFFTREGGVSEGLYAGLNVGLGSNDDPARVRENRAAVAGNLGVEPSRLLTPFQVHSADVVTLSDDDLAGRPRADAFVTATPGFAIGVVTADCGPILFADPKAGVIGAAHAGWRGAISGILENTIDAMEKLGARRSSIVAALGPTISRENYEVGPEFHAHFVERDPAYAGYFIESPAPGRKMFDLPRFILDRLAASGVRAEMIGRCTYRDEERYFSFRRTTHRGEPDYGRQISAISLRE